jgi:hypothetical protein
MDSRNSAVLYTGGVRGGLRRCNRSVHRPRQRLHAEATLPVRHSSAAIPWLGVIMQSAALITCHRSHLEARCTERGYALNEVMPCVVSIDGDEWTIDVEHPAYPRVSRLPEPPATPASGPGTELSRLLKRFGIEPTPTCACRAKAAQMNVWGPDECERPERIDEVVAAMRSEATARGLPFLDVAGRLLVRRAIANARRNA